MAQVGDERLQTPPIQGLFINGRDLIFRAKCFDLLSPSRFLLSWFFSIRLIIKCSEVLTRCPPDEVVGELFIIIISVILLAQGTNIRMSPNDLVRGVMQIATNKQVLLLYFFGIMISGSHADNQNECFQIVCGDPNVWETRDYALMAAALTLLVGLLIIGVVIRPPPVPAVPEVVPAIPEAALALPIYPAVQGDDIDDVLARAPAATRRNSPLESWL